MASKTGKIECPFDLDEFMQSDQLRAGQLKEALQVIFENLDRLRASNQELETKMVSKFLAIDTISNKCDQNKASLDGMNKVIAELTSKSNDAENDISELKCDIE